MYRPRVKHDERSTRLIIGDIVKSKFYFVIELRRNNPWQWLGPSFGKTYNGTKSGVVFCFGIGHLMAHIR